MRISAAVLAVALLATSPASTPAQDNLNSPDGAGVFAVNDQEEPNRILAQPARLDVREAELEEAFDQLQEASGVPIAYSPALLPSDLRVTCECSELTVGQAMERLLEGTAFEFVVLASQIVVRQSLNAPPSLSAPIPVASDVPIRLPEERIEEVVEPPPAQGVGVITGRVTAAESGQPIPSVQVHIADLDLGVLSQANGRYLLQNVPTGTHTVTAERIGYRTVTAEVTISDAETVVQDFTLGQEALALDEVIVTGTPGGTQRRALGNSVGQVEAANIANSAGIRFEQNLGSSVPGVRMMAPSGQAGGASPIRIRGSSSLALGGDPLIYVDGIRISTRRVFDNRASSTSRLQDIDPSTIESIEVIKGPAAATLYGTEASNGVIQIITKKGVEGETTFEASAEMGMNWQPHPSRNFGLHWYEDPGTGEIRNHNIYELMKQSEHFGDDLWQNGPIQRYNVSARGGTDIVRYFASISRDDVEGFSRRDYTESWSARASLTLVPAEDFSLTLNAHRMTGSTRDVGFIQCLYDCWANPVQDRRVDGGLADEHRGHIEADKDIRFRDRTIWNIQLSHNPTGWFSHRITGGVDNSGIKRVDFVPRVGDEAYGGTLGTCGRIGCRSVTNLDTPTRTIDYSATVSLPVTDQLSTATSVGLQYFEESNTGLTLSGSDFSVETLETIGGANARDASEDYVENITVGTFLQNEFNWEDRIFLTGAVRFDDNSAFGREFDAAVYPKVSGSWVLSEESFWEDPLGVTSFRLRGAWGRSGQQPDAFAATRLWNPITGPGEPALTPVAIGNPDLGPEIGSEIELGFDAAVWDERVSLDFTWFNRTTTDAIVARPIRPSVGFPGSQLVNIGETSAWGTETSLSAQLYEGNPVRWDMNLAFTTLGNRIDDMGGLDRITVVALSGMESRAQYHVEGFPIAGLFEKRVLSAEFVSGDSGPITNAMCDGGTGRNGLEIGGDPVPCDEAPHVFWGQVDPSWQISLNSSWTLFEDWRLSATIDAMGGHHLNADYIAGQNTRHSEKHVKENDPIFQANQTYARAGNVIHAAGFAKLREISLRYSLPEYLTGRIGASSASIRGAVYNVTNLWIEDEYTPSGQRIWDPEMVSPNFEYNGVATGNPPPLSHATIRLDVVF